MENWLLKEEFQGEIRRYETPGFLSMAFSLGVLMLIALLVHTAVKVSQGMTESEAYSDFSRKPLAMASDGDGVKVTTALKALENGEFAQAKRIARSAKSANLASFQAAVDTQNLEAATNSAREFMLLTRRLSLDSAASAYLGEFNCIFDTGVKPVHPAGEQATTLWSQFFRFC